MESILQSSLLADAVAQEQRRAQVRHQRRSVDSECPPQKPAEPTSPAAVEHRVWEQALREREKALKEREERLERKPFISINCQKYRFTFSFLSLHLFLVMVE